MSREFNKLPENPLEEAAGLKEAIEATKKRIAEYGADPDLESHLKSLEQQLKMAEKRMHKAA